MEWIASTLHTTSEHGVSSITTADAHTSAASSRLNWRLHRFKRTCPFRRKTKSGFCACVVTFQLTSTALLSLFTAKPLQWTTADRWTMIPVTTPWHAHNNLNSDEKWSLLYLYVTPYSLIESYERYVETCASIINVCNPVDGVSNILRNVGTSRTTELLIVNAVGSSNTSSFVNGDIYWISWNEFLFFNVCVKNYCTTGETYPVLGRRINK
jgi:hypothetical protein